SNFRRATHWAKTVSSVGLSPDFHFHDLRHTGNQLAAEAGATTKELMRRMGHSTVRAAMRYQHSTDRRDREIAAEMSRRAGLSRPVASGAERARCRYGDTR